MFSGPQVRPNPLFPARVHRNRLRRLAAIELSREFYLIVVSPNYAEGHTR